MPSLNVSAREGNERFSKWLDLSEKIKNILKSKFLKTILKFLKEQIENTLPCEIHIEK